MSEDMKVNELLPFVTEVISAQLSNNKTALSAVAPLIQSVYQVLDELRTKGTPAELPAPAVPKKTSITPDYIVCLEDGKQLKMLKRLNLLIRHRQLDRSPPSCHFTTPRSANRKRGIPQQPTRSMAANFMESVV
jgi:predicted transcriptional regulator